MSPARPRPRPVRRYPRLTLRVEVELDFGERRIRAVATTLGAGGLFVAIDDAPDPGTPLMAHFRLPGEELPLALMARIAWRSPGAEGRVAGGMGLEFIDAGARARLAEQLERWAKQREDAAG